MFKVKQISNKHLIGLSSVTLTLLLSFGIEGCEKTECMLGMSTCSPDHQMILVCERGEWVPYVTCPEGQMCMEMTLESISEDEHDHSSSTGVSIECVVHDHAAGEEHAGAEHSGDVAGEHAGVEHAGDVAGEHAGDVAGEHAGDVAGEHAGDVAGEHAGAELAGDMAGSTAGDMGGEVGGAGTTPTPGE